MTNDYLTYNQKFADGEGKAIQIRYEVRTQEGKNASLTQKQQNIISDALSNQVKLDVKKKHNLKITIVEKDKFKVVLDNKFSFFISKGRGYDHTEASEKIVIIQEKIKNRTLFSNFKEFFRSIYYLFYSPAYPSVAAKDRQYRAVVQQDFRALRKGLEQGKNWLSSETETKITSKQEQERVTLTKQVESSIFYAKKIEAALSQKDQYKALSTLANEISNKIIDPNNPEMEESIVIPAGYVNADNTLQPVMYRFYRNEKDHLCLEIYSDVAEGISKFPPTIVREFTQQEYTKETLINMMGAIFSPLIEKKVDQKKLMKAIEPSPMFTEIYESKVERKEEPKEKSKIEAISKAPLISEGKITYEILVTSIEEIIGKFTEDVTPKNQKLINTVQSPAERVTRWFDHLAGGKISTNEKIYLLNTITEQWVNDQLRQISKETSLERQKEGYQDVLATISRVKEKISLAIHEGVPIGPEFGLSDSLLSMEKLAQENIDKISEKIRKEKIDLSTGQLERKQKSIVGIPIKPVQVTEEKQKIRRKTISQSGEIEKLNKQWDEVSKNIGQLFSEETLKTAQKREVIENLDKVAKELETSFPEVASVLNEFVMSLARSGDIDQKNLHEVIEKLFINTGFAQSILKELVRKSSHIHFEASPDEFIHIMEQIILSPHLIPKIKDRSTKKNENGLYRFIRKVKDPNSRFPAECVPAIEAMRAILGLPLLISKENKNVLFNDAWTRQPDIFIKEKIEPLMQTIAHQVLPDLTEKERVRLNTLSLKEKVELLGKLNIPNPGVQNMIHEVQEKYEFYLLLCKQSKLDSIKNISQEIVSTLSIADQKVNISTIEADSFEYREDIVKTLDTAVQQIKLFYQCAETQTDPEEKKAILEEARRRTFEIVKNLPVPGSEGAEGIPSIWYGFSEEQRNSLFRHLHEMEHILWESQLRLAKTDISGKEQFFQIKIQAIRQALIRSKVRETQLAFEEFLVKFRKPGDSNDPCTKLYDALMKDGHLHVELIQPEVEKELARLVHQKVAEKAISPNEAIRCNASFLRLEKFTLDTDAINQVLTQDLTSSLSSEPDLHRQLLSLYHFVLRDRNAGEHEGVLSPDPNLAPFERAKRKPLFSEEEFGIKNTNPFWSPEQLAQSFKDRLTPEAYQSIEFVLNSLIKSHFYAQTSKDPNFTIHALSPTVGTPFFEGQPETMLAQSHLEIQHTVQGESHEYHIINEQKQRVAEICTRGHPNYCEMLDNEEQDQLPEQERELLIRPQRKCNPIVQNELMKQGQYRTVHDSRIYAPFDVWHKYVTEISQNQEQAIPPAALQQLFQIRQAPDRHNGYSFTSYSPVTSLNALEFITNTENQNYLKLDFVQNFLDESLFGPFVLQQAIIYYPEEIQKQSELLGARLLEAQKKEDSELVAFYTNLIHRISQQVNLTKETLLTQGLLSGTVNGSLPCSVAAYEENGLLFNSLLNSVYLREGGMLNVISLGGKDTPSHLPVTNIQQPLIELMNKINNANESFQILARESDQIFSEMFFVSEKKPLDQVNDPQLKKNLSIYLLEGYQRKMNAGKDLQPKEFHEIILAYQLLLDERIETSLNQKKNELIDWVRGKILPRVTQDQMRNASLQNFLHHQFKTPIKVVKSTPISNTVATYEVELQDRKYVVNLYTMTIEGIEEESPMVREIFIPDDVIHNRAFSQAIHKTNVKAAYTKKSDGRDEYVWKEDGQKFKVMKHQEQIHIQRTIEEGPFRGTYTFSPVLEVEANNDASAILAENGIWQKRGENLPKYIFSKGSFLPTPQDVFEASHDWKEGVLSIKEIKSKENGNILTSEDLSSASPVLFASSQNVITLLDPVTKIPSEIRVKNSTFSLKKEDGQWVVHIAGVKQGKIAYPEDEKTMVENFGEHWDRYVIPFESEKTERKLVNGIFKKIPVTERQYLVFPYPQTVDLIGNVTIDQKSSIALQSPMIFKVDKEGIVKGPIAGELYLAHSLIMQSAMTKNPTMARALLLQAESHMANIRAERPTSDPEEMRQLQAVFSQISHNQAVELTKQTHPEAIAQNIKLLLNVRKIRKMLETQGGKMLLSPKENYHEKQYLAKLYEAYLVYENKKIHGMFKEPKIHKTSFALQDGEKKELDQITDTLLQDIKNSIMDQSFEFESFFGISPRLVGTISIDPPEKVNPDFLLSLVRMAKPVEKGVSLKSVKGPISLDMLLENYWSYFISIKNERLKPEDLLFLFQESRLSPTKSVEEREHLKAVDKQARQFLLAFANLQEQFGGEIHPYDKAMQEINEYKQNTLPSIKAGSDSDKLFTLFGLSASFGQIRQQMEKLHVEKMTFKVKEKDIVAPNIEKLDRDLREMVIYGTGFSGQISAIVSDFKKIFSQVDADQKKFMLHVKELEKEKKNISDEMKETSRGVGKLSEQKQKAYLETLQKRMNENDAALSNLNKDYEEFLSTSITAPGLGQVTKRQLMGASFQRQYEQLQEAQRSFGESLEALKTKVDSLEQTNKQLMTWIEMEKIIIPLQETSFNTSPWFRLPEKGKGKDFIMQRILGTGEELGFKDLASVGFGIVKEIGISKTKKLAEDFSVREKYEEQKKIRDRLKDPLNDKERAQLEKSKVSDKEFDELERKYASSILEKLTMFAAPLKGLEMLAQEDTEKTPITVEKGKREQKETFETLSGDIVAKYFTEKERELIDEKMTNFSSKDQKTILGSLSEALRLKESVVSAKIESGKNVEVAKELFASRISSEKKPQNLTPLKIISLSRKDSFTKDFRQFFTSGIGFKKDLSTARRLDAEKKVGVRPEKANFLIHSRIDLIRTMKAQERIKHMNGFKNSVKEFVNELVPLENREIQPYVKALDVILQSFDIEPPLKAIMQEQDSFLAALQKIPSRQMLLQEIEKSYEKMAPMIHEHQHKQLVDRLEKTLPLGDSSYRSDLKKGIDNLREHDPLPFASVIREDELESLGLALESSAQDLEESVSAKKKVALTLIKELNPKELPSEILRIRLQKKGDQELLDVALKRYRKGDLQNHPELEQILSAYLIDHTRLQALMGQKDSAAASLSILYELQSQKNEIFEKLGGKINNQEKSELEKKLEIINIQWARESSKIQDFTERCQSTAHLESLGSLQPHMRKILYLQYRQGMVLRKNQIETLQQIVSKPSLLKQLRMGLGKTSVILPFALEILASEGYNPIGIVPKALFGTNFNEMDATTRLIFELSGNQFLFSGEDIPSALTPASLSHLTQKTKDFLQALENGEFVLTTIESKASLDDKIAEFESIQRVFLEKWESAQKEEGPEAEAREREAYLELINRQTALDALYQIKGVFEAEKTRLVIDEVDQVARANYTVNSEKGLKESLDPGLQQAAATIFDLLRDLPELEPLRNEIAANNQFTLTDEQINQYIKLIGTSWIENKKLPEGVKREDVLNWFAGSESPFTVSQIQTMGVSLRAELQNMRRALNSALRSSLHHKIGLNGDFDPVHKTIGVPAAQGVTSKTTKYSDPLMQLVLTHMIAFYKPQGETFLRSAAQEVFQGLQRDLEEIHKTLAKEGVDHGLEVISLIGKSVLIEDAMAKMQDLFEVQKTTGAAPSYTDAFSGTDAVSIFLRQKFAEQVAKRKLIYVSGDQISRPVQDALRGCNVIGLTGTATRNTEFVVTGSNPEALEEIDQSGRQTTAEVLLRLSKALDNGLDTEVKTYATQSDQAIAQLRALAGQDSGYHYLVNQAGACDKLTIDQIVKELHAGGQRPIVHLSLDGKTKLVLIRGNLKALDKLTETEKEEVKTKGFYYYHTPHARGTHFDIPSGSKGALFLSPTVNANDRDQAAYRARALGEGHRIEIWISEKQKQELGGAGVTVAQVLQIHHEQTKNDEQTEDLSAYRLHVQGFLKKGVENLKKEIQETLKPKGSLLAPEQKDKFITFFKQEAIVSEMFEHFFIQDSGNQAYQRLLSKEMYGKGEIPTIDSLTLAVENEIHRAETLLAKLDKESLGEAFTIVEKHLKNTIISLTQERTKFDTEEFKEKISKQFPPMTTSSQAANTTAETEAEAEEEQEIKAEAHSEVETKRQQSTKKILQKIDMDLLNGLDSDSITNYTLFSLRRIFNPAEGKQHNQLEDSWREDIFISTRLQRHIQESIGTTPPLAFLITLQQDGKQNIAAVDQFEATQCTNLAYVGSIPTYYLPPNNLTTLGSCFTVKPVRNSHGEAELMYSSSGILTGNCEDQLDGSLKGKLGLTLIAVGYTQLNAQLWNDIITYWKGCNDVEKQSIRQKFEGILSRNPSFLSLMADKLWNAP